MEAEREAEASLDVRLAMLATEGISAEIVYPTIGLYAWSLPDAELGVACCSVLQRLDPRAARRPSTAGPARGDDPDVVGRHGRDRRDRTQARHRFATARCSHHRLAGLEPSPMGAALGRRLTAAPAMPGGHASGHRSRHDLRYAARGAATTNLVTTQAMAPRTAALLSCVRRARALPRHSTSCWSRSTPDGWPGRCPPSTSTTSHTAHLRGPPILAELPSHYLRRQVHATFQRDPVGVANRALTGVDCLMWGGEFFPTPRDHLSRTPSTSLAELFADVGPADAAAIAGGTAARIFGFDGAALGATLGGTARS